MRRLALLLPTLILGGMIGGCGDRNVTPFLGKWTGGLEVLRVQGGGDPKPYELHGDLQMYVRKFELNLTGPQQTVMARGTWSYEGKRVRLRATSIKFGDAGGAEQRDPNKAYLEPQDLQAFLGREQGLNLSQDGKRLAGVEDGLANLIARLAFVKD
ncbi:hypothetical protein EON77_03550 [bacterium]|nr:MAG: hypothetical protein EON77_03550 [bacterium]